MDPVIESCFLYTSTNSENSPLFTCKIEVESEETGLGLRMTEKPFIRVYKNFSFFWNFLNSV